MALALAIIFSLVALVTALLFAGGYWPLPALISSAHGIDAQFAGTLLITGIALVLTHGLLAYFIYRYRASKQAQHGSAPPTRGNARIEVGCALVVTIIFAIIAILGERNWAQLRLSAAAPDAITIEVTARQFVWLFRYPGADGKFGRIKLAAVSERNPLGIDADDLAGRDDIVQQGELMMPAGRNVQLILRAQDVIHSLFIPPLRIKQDAVPGLLIPVHFTATQTGDYEVACAELCGRDHYKMRARLHIFTAADFDKWLGSREQVPEP
jgi:cytochrome c oxidase subunit II